ncbi:MAG: alpha-amylase family protein [Prevotellaceae bacterium]|jgi:glycosidase|nr:alpha-amylase family protein [Prevotellaceae bacterium]
MKVIIYQAFVRHFSIKKGQNKPNGTIEENLCGKFNNFNSNALKSIKNLGATHIWLTGIIEHASQTAYNQHNLNGDSADIVKGIAGSPYAIRDYYDVSPDLAENVENRMQEFENLVERAHKNGLKVIIDFVPNHVSRVYHSDVANCHCGLDPQSLENVTIAGQARNDTKTDFGKNDDKTVHFSPQNNFYYFPNQPFSPQFELKTYSEFPAKATGNDCFSPSPSKNDWYETVKLNYGVDYQNNMQKYFEPLPDTWLKMRDILLFWAGKNIDGFRCDMAEMVPVEFWHWAIAEVKKQFPNIIFIAEIYNYSQYKNFLEYGKFDFLYDKIGLYDTLRGVICGHLPAKNISFCWQNLGEIQDKMLNFLENHDEQRICSDFFASNPNAAKPAMVVSACLNRSAAMIYAGQELGEKGMNTEGFSGLDGRTTIFDYWQPDTLFRWASNGDFSLKNLTKKEKDLRSFYSKLFKICQKTAISSGAMFDLMYCNEQNPDFNSEKCFAFLRAFSSRHCVAGYDPQSYPQSSKKQEIPTCAGMTAVLIVANFSPEKQFLKINIPQHAFDCLQISPKENFAATDLLSNKKCAINFCANLPVEIELEGFESRIFEIL